MQRQWKGFVAGALAATLISSLVSPTLAALASKTIQVYTGVNVYVDDQLIQPKDANGDPVEVFAYNGTTYLPVRAIGQALGKTIQWDGATNSVYVGRHTKKTKNVTLSLSNSDTYRKLNFFLSYFSEGDLVEPYLDEYSFSVEAPNYEALVRFALMYALGRDESLVEEGDFYNPDFGDFDNVRISPANVKKIARELFSSDLDLSGVDSVCNAGHNTTQLTNGFFPDSFVLADSITSLGGNRFQVKFHEYTVEDPTFPFYDSDSGSAVYSAKPSQLASLFYNQESYGSILSIPGEATIEAVQQPDKSVTFLLRTYTVN